MGRPLTQEERDKIDNTITEFEIIRNGKRMKMRPDGVFVPITGSQAQALTGKKKTKPA